MEPSFQKIKEIHQVIEKAFHEFDLASKHRQEAEKVRNKGGKNLPQAASYGLLGFAVVLILVQSTFYIGEAILNRDLSAYTFLSNLLPLSVGVGIYFYFNRKNSQAIDHYTQIADEYNKNGREILFDNYNTIKELHSDYWYPLATKSIQNYLHSHPDQSIDEAIKQYDRLIENAYSYPIDQQLVDDYKKSTLQLYIVQRHQDFDEYLSDN